MAAASWEGCVGGPPAREIHQLPVQRASRPRHPAERRSSSRHNCTLTAPCAQRLCALSAMRACGASLHLAAPRRAASRAFSHASAAPCAAQPARTQLRVARAVRAAPPRGRRGDQATCSPAAWPALQPRVAAGSSRSLCSWPLLCRSVALPAARPKRPMFHSTVSSRR